MSSPNVILSEALQLEVGGKKILCTPIKTWFLIITASEPWPGDVQLFQPFEVEQVLLPDNANILAVQAFLNMSNLEYMIEMRANAEHMSPSGNLQNF